MADLESIEARVKKAVSEILGTPMGQIEPDHLLVEDLGAQSIQSVELLAAFEEEFDIEIDEDEAMAVKTVGGAVEFINKCIGEQKS